MSSPSADHQNGFVIRKFEIADLSACAELAAEAWPSDVLIASHENQLAGMESYMRSCLHESTWAEVVCESNNVVGFLYGSIKKDMKSRGFILPRESLPSMIAGLGRYGDYITLLRMIWNVYLTELKITLNRPASDAEIIMLIVAAKHRGKGLGKLLVDRFVEAAREAGARELSVYTDDQSSNWQFYELQGFRRVASFYDNVSSFFMGKPSNGVIYVLNLQPRRPEALAETH